MYTRVLMGNLDLQMAKFPAKRTTGHSLEMLSRQHLWEVGQDYGHSVGHSVAHCGPVHEYPHFAFARHPNHQLMLEEGMILTNEPGFYKAGHYGIRIENILTVKKCEQFDEFLQFENMTYLPYCKELLDIEMLSERHREEIHRQYQVVKEKVVPLVEN